MEKRNVCISDDFGMNFVVIETDKAREEIEKFCFAYCRQEETGIIEMTISEVGKMVFDSNITEGNPPEYKETYFIEDYR